MTKMFSWSNPNFRELIIKLAILFLAVILAVPENQRAILHGAQNLMHLGSHRTVR